MNEKIAKLVRKMESRDATFHRKEFIQEWNTLSPREKGKLRKKMMKSFEN